MTADVSENVCPMPELASLPANVQTVPKYLSSKIEVRLPSIRLEI
jgi:hypothetical protein